MFEAIATNMRPVMTQPGKMHALAGMSGPQQVQGYNGAIDPATGLPYQFGNGAGSGTYDQTAAGSDWIMNGDPTQGTGGQSGDGAGVTDYLHSATALGDLAPTLQSLGYTGNIVDQGTGGDSGSASSVDPAVIQWLQQNGYNIGARPDATDASGGSNYYGLFKGNQAVADPTKVKSDDNSFQYALMAAAAAATAGAAAYGGGADAAGLGAEVGGGADAAEGIGGSGGLDAGGFGASGLGGASGDTLATGVGGAGTSLSTAAGVPGVTVGTAGEALGAGGAAAGGLGGAAGTTSPGFVSSLTSGDWGGALDAAGNYISSPGGINLLGGIANGLIGANAASKASDAQTAAAQKALELQKYMYDTTRSDQAPYRATGAVGAAGMTNLLQNPSSITSDPSYAFGLGQGVQGVDRSAAGKGSLYSGATLKALDRYGQDYAGTKLNDAFGRYSTAANLGEAATTGTSAAGSNYANNGGADITGAGNAQAGADLYGANVWQNSINNGLAAYNRSTYGPAPRP